MHHIVWFQLCSIWIVIYVVYKSAARRDGKEPIDHVGVIWLLALGMYVTAPTIPWILGEGKYEQSNYRLVELSPTVEETVYLVNIAIGYVLGFSLVYLTMLSRVGRRLCVLTVTINKQKIIGATVILALATLVLAAIRNLGYMPEADSYIDSYAVVAQLPLALRQVIKTLGGISFVAKQVIILAVYQHWPRYRWIIYMFIGSILVGIDPSGSRTGTVTSVLTLIIGWHILVRPIPRWTLLSGGILGVVAFSIMGIVRESQGSIAGLMATNAQVNRLGEFGALWANGIELLQAKDSGRVDVPGYVRFGELFAFVPSQLLWFEKDSLSNWYLDRFHPLYKALGGGWAFGAISQAVIGDGIPEAALRGAFSGWLAGWLMRTFRKPTSRWWMLPLQLYLLVWMYQSIRDTTFTLLGAVVQIAIPAFLLIWILGEVIVRKRPESKFTRI